MSTIPEVSLSNVAFISSHIESMLFLKPSLVFHRCTNAAMSTAITATTATTGADIPPIAAPRVEKAVLAPAIIVGTLLIKDIKPPTDDMTFPITTNKGPIAAAARAIFTIVCFVAGSIALSLSINA